MNDIITIKCPKDKLTLLDMWKYNLCIQDGGFVKGVYNGICDDYDSDNPTKYSNFKEFINGEFPQVKKNAYLKTVFGGLNFEVAQFENEKQFKEQFDIENEEENFSLQNLTNRLNAITFAVYDDETCTWYGKNCVQMRYLPTNKYLAYVGEDDEEYLDEFPTSLPNTFARSLAKRIDPDMSNWEVIDVSSEEDFALKPWKKAAAIGVMGLGLASGHAKTPQQYNPKPIEVYKPKNIIATKVHLIPLDLDTINYNSIKNFKSEPNYLKSNEYGIYYDKGKFYLLKGTDTQGYFKNIKDLDIFLTKIIYQLNYDPFENIKIKYLEELNSNEISAIKQSKNVFTYRKHGNSYTIVSLTNNNDNYIKLEGDTYKAIVK